MYVFVTCLNILAPCQGFIFIREVDSFYRDFLKFGEMVFLVLSVLLIGVVPGVWWVHSSPGAGDRPWTIASSAIFRALGSTSINALD